MKPNRKTADHGRSNLKGLKQVWSRYSTHQLSSRKEQKQAQHQQLKSILIEPILPTITQTQIKKKQSSIASEIKIEAQSQKYSYQQQENKQKQSKIFTQEQIHMSDGFQYVDIIRTETSIYLQRTRKVLEKQIKLVEGITDQIKTVVQSSIEVQADKARNLLVQVVCQEIQEWKYRARQNFFKEGELLCWAELSEMQTQLQERLNEIHSILPIHTHHISSIWKGMVNSILEGTYEENIRQLVTMCESMSQSMNQNIERIMHHQKYLFDINLEHCKQQLLRDLRDNLLVYIPKNEGEKLALTFKTPSLAGQSKPSEQNDGIRQLHDKFTRSRKIHLQSLIHELQQQNK